MYGKSNRRLSKRRYSYFTHPNPLSLHTKNVINYLPTYHENNPFEGWIRKSDKCKRHTTLLTVWLQYTGNPEDSPRGQERRQLIKNLIDLQERQFISLLLFLIFLVFQRQLTSANSDCFEWEKCVASNVPHTLTRRIEWFLRYYWA